MSGDYQLEDTIYIPFSTRQFSDGVPTALIGSPIVTGYRDANLTQFVTGITLADSFDGVSGLNLITIVATAANGYVAGESYTLYLSAGTVGGVSVVGEVVGHFTLETAPVNWGKVTSPTTAVDLSATDIQLADTVTTLTNLPVITANWLTAAGINAGALDGKGDWNIGKTGYALTTAEHDAIVDKAWDELLSGHLTFGSFGQILNAIGGVAGRVNDASATTTDFDTDGFTEATADHFNGHTLIFTSGILKGQARIITDYTTTGQNVFFERAFTDIPGNNDEFVITGILSGSLRRALTSDNSGIVSADVQQWRASIPAVLAAGGRVDADQGAKSGNVALSTQEKLDVNAEADAAIVTAHLDHLFAVDYDPAAKPGISTALLNELVEDDGGVSRFTSNAIEQVWSVATRTLSAFSTGLAVSVWDVLESAIVTASSIGLKLKTNVDALLSDIEADTSNIQTRLPTVGPVEGTAESGSTTTVVDTANRTESQTDYWKGSLIRFTNGTLLGVTRLITGFNFTTDTITFSPVAPVAVATHTYEIIPVGRADIELVLGFLINPMVSGRVDTSVGAMQLNVLTAAAIAMDAIGADELAASGINEIRDGILADSTAFNGADIALIKAETEKIANADAGAGAAGSVIEEIENRATPADLGFPQKNIALSNIEFLFVAASDHVTPITAASGTSITRSIDGGSFGAGTGTLAEVGNGIYQYDASAGDMNGDIITFRFIATGGTPGAPDDAFLTIKTRA